MADASWWASLRHGGLLLSPAQVARLDEMPLALLAVWGLAVAAIARAVQGEAPRGRAAVQAVPTR